MRIALNVKYFTPRGGAQTFLRYLAEGLVSGGNEVDVYAMEGPGGLPCSSFRPVRVGPCPKALRDYRFAVRSARALSKTDYDVIFGEQKAFYLDVVRPGGGLWREYIEREIRSLEGRPLSRLARRFSLKERMNRELEEKLYTCPRLKHVVVNSRATADAIRAEYGLPPERLHVVYNGVDLDRFHPERRGQMRPAARASLGIAEDDYVLLFLATNFRLKGLRPLLRALSNVPGQALPAPLRLVAAGQRRAGPYARMAAGLGMRDRVLFLGPREPDELYAAADVLVHPTFHDPCANVCLEAMAMGLPVVTTGANGASELIRDGVGGFVIGDALDEDAIGKSVAALSDAAVRGPMGKAAREAVDGLTPRKNVEEVLRILRIAAEEKRGAE